MVRDQVKDKSYWEKKKASDIENLEDLIVWLQENRSASPRHHERIRRRTEQLHFGYIFSLFSQGADVAVCRKEFISHIRHMSKLWNDSFGYYTLLQYSSLALMLHVDTETVRRLVDMYHVLDISDAFVETILNQMDPSVQITNEYVDYALIGPMIEMINGKRERNAAELGAFLRHKWYDLHKEAPWYGTHKNNEDLYDGYWCFEAGAAVVIMGIDDSCLKTQPYYPYDMVHYQYRPEDDQVKEMMIPEVMDYSGYIAPPQAPSDDSPFSFFLSFFKRK